MKNQFIDTRDDLAGDFTNHPDNKYKHNGLRECPKCRKTSWEEYSIFTFKDRYIGKMNVRIACACYGERKGEVLERTKDCYKKCKHEGCKNLAYNSHAPEPICHEHENT